MAGTVAHVLNINFFDAINMPMNQLSILYNEAERQRALDAEKVGMAFGSERFGDYIQRTMLIHGDYTEGFYESQYDMLKKMVGK